MKASSVGSYETLAEKKRFAPLADNQVPDSRPRNESG
jgi:hypothetical protein